MASKKAKKKRNAVINVYLDPELKEAFEELCEGQRVTMSSYLERKIFWAVKDNQL